MLFGICVVDAFLAYKYECQMSAVEAKNFTDFLGRLVHQLIFNIFLDQGMVVRRQEDMDEDIEEVSNWTSIDKQQFCSTNFLTYFFYH